MPLRHDGAVQRVQHGLAGLRDRRVARFLGCQLSEVSEVDVGRRDVAAEYAGERLGVAARFGYRALVHALQRQGKLIDGRVQFRHGAQVNRRQRDAALQLAGDLGGGPGTAADKTLSCPVVDDALVVADVGVHYGSTQPGAVHARIIDQLIEETGVSPAKGRLRLLGCNTVARVLLQDVENFHVAHQAGIQTDQLKLVDAGGCSDLAQRLIELHEIQLVANGCCQRNAPIAAAARVGVAPAARPAHPMV